MNYTINFSIVLFFNSQFRDKKNLQYFCLGNGRNPKWCKFHSAHNNAQSKITAGKKTLCNSNLISTHVSGRLSRAPPTVVGPEELEHDLQEETTIYIAIFYFITRRY